MIDFNPKQNQISHQRLPAAPIAKRNPDVKVVPPLAVQLDAKDTWIPAGIAQKAGTVGASFDAWGQLGGFGVADAEEVAGGGLVPNSNEKLPTKFSPVSRRECAAVLKSMSFGTDSLCHADAARLAMMVHDIPSPASLV